jgi:hypothetical protein
LRTFVHAARRRAAARGRTIVAGPAPTAACVAGLPLTCSLDRDPLTGATSPTELGEATTNVDGQAKLTVETTGWSPGSYELTVDYPGNNLGRLPSSTAVEVTLAGRAGPVG